MFAFATRTVTTAFTISRRATTVTTTTTSQRQRLIQPFSFSSSSSTTSSRISSGNMPFWNREESAPKAYSLDAPIVQEARILSLSNPDDPANARLHKGELPEGASLLQIGTKMEEFDIEELKKQNPNVLFVSHPKVSWYYVALFSIVYTSPQYYILYWFISNQIIRIPLHLSIIFNLI
jgi:hypothetical protein